MNILLVGGSGAFGSAIKREAQNRSVELVSVSRGVSEDDKSYFCDLSDLSSILIRLQEIKEVDSNTVAIINSGVIGPIGFGAEIKAEDALSAFNINALSNLPVFQSLYARGVKNFVVISSGAANKDYSGWFTYCQSKKLQKALWESLCHDHDDISVRFIAPGVLDSSMHDFTSSVDRSKYPELDKFFDIKNAGAYQNSEESAKKLFDLMEGRDFSSVGSEFIDLRDL